MSKKIRKLTVNGIDYDLSSSGGSGVDVIDNLTTEDSDSALSANQGKILNDKIELIETESIVAEYEEETATLDLQFNVPVQGVVEDTLDSNNSYNALSANQGRILKESVDTATAIAKGKNQARVFATTEKMYEWLSDEANKGVAMKGDNLYIVDVGVPDWWISEVLEEANADGRYYNVAQLETQKVDLTTINNAISDLQDDVNEINNDLGTMFKYASGNKETNIPEGVFAVTVPIEVPNGYSAIALRNYNMNNRYNVSITAVYVNGAYVTILGQNNRPAFDTRVDAECVVVKTDMLVS